MKKYNYIVYFVLLIGGILFYFLPNCTDEYVAYTYDEIGNKFGDLSADKVYRDGEYINLDKYKPVKDGYTFKGWTKTGNCNEIIHTDIVSVGVTYKACYVKNDSSTSNSGKTNAKSAFVLQGGILKSSDATIGSTVDLNKVVVTRSGYRFVGWYTASSGGSKVTGVRKLDSVVYAHWEPYRLTIHYNGNDGTWCGKSGSGYSANSKGTVLYKGAISSLTRNYGAVVSEKYGLSNYDNNVAVCFKRKGYLALSGGEWNTKSNGTGVSFNHNNTKLTTLDVAKGAGCDLTTRDCEVTLYVNWKSTTATNVQLSVSLNANGGTVSSKNIQTVKVNKNSSINLNNYVPVRTGYVFNGWYTNSTGGSKVSGSRKISKNTNYYAHWTAKTISVNFYRNASSSDTTKVTQKFTYGKSNQKFGSTGFSKSGYTLVGWSLAKGGAKNYEVLSGVANNWINNNYPSINLYAVWSNDTNVSVKSTTNASKNVSCYQAKAKSTGSRTILKTITASNVEKTIKVANPSCKGGSCTTLQGMSILGDKIVVLKIKNNNDSSILVYSVSSGKLLKTYHVNNSSLYHANGVTVGHDGKFHVVTMDEKKNYAFSLDGNNINFVKSGSSFANDVLGVSNISGGPSYFSGIAYDNSTRLYYFSVGSRIFKYDISNKKVLKVASRFVNTPQDIGAYNGIILSVQSVGQNSNYLDLYRASDMAYVGSYHITIPVKYDVESVDFYNGKMVLNANDSTDKIHILKSGVVDFNRDCTN